MKSVTTTDKPARGIATSFYQAIFFILLAIFLFDIQGLLIKYLGDRYPIPQLAFFRNIFGIMPVAILLFCSAQWHRDGRPLAIVQWRLALLRGLYVAGAQFCFYLALTKMAFATATTLAFIGPVFITILSVLLLRNRVGIWRWSAVVIGFIGVLWILRPGSALFTFYAFLPLLASFGYSLSIVSMRLIDDEVPTMTINLYASVGALFGSLCLLVAIGDYAPVASLGDWLWMMLMGSVGGVAVICLVSAYRLTDPCNLSPFEYFGIPFAFFLGWFFFAEAPVGQLFPGVLLVVGGGLLIAWRERLQDRSCPVL